MASAFGFGPMTEGWITEKAEKLLSRLRDMVALEVHNHPDEFQGQRLTVHYNEREDMVKIHRLDHCSPEMRERIMNMGDLIYREVMELPVAEGQEHIPRI